MDTVIIGGGLAGLSTAYGLAREGLEVIVIERGDHPGSKNMTGGRLYLEPLKRFYPELWEEAPFERWVTKERITLISGQKAVTLEYSNPELLGHSATVLRSHLDKWLSEKVQEAGAFVIPQKKAVDLIWDGDRVVGVNVEGEELPSKVVVIADGVLSFIGQKAGLRTPLTPEKLALGYKEVIRIGEEEVQRRFNLEENQGLAHLFFGSLTKGHFGGAFLYTNRDTLSLGIVIGLAGAANSKDMNAPELIEEFKARSEIAPLIEGGEILEYSAHLIPEGALDCVKGLYGNGVLLVGDAAGFTINHGFTVRGMDLALLSGLAASKAVLYAFKRSDFSKNTLSFYIECLKEYGIWKEIYKFRKNSKILSSTTRLYTEYPKWVCNLVGDLFFVNAGGREKLRSILWKHLKDVLWDLRLWKDLWKLKEL